MDNPDGDLTSLLVRVAERADKAAFATLFHHFAPRIRSYGLRHLGSEANAMELVQETMLLVWQKARLYHPDKGAATTWIYTVMRNQSFDMLRRRRASKEELCAEEIWPLLEFRAEEEHLSGGEDAVLTRQMAHYVSTPVSYTHLQGRRLAMGLSRIVNRSDPRYRSTCYRMKRLRSSSSISLPRWALT